MENTTTERELLENVSMSEDVGTAQYTNMIQRMGVENTQLLSSDLLHHHNGLVVDLGAGDFIPVNYASEDLLTQDLTEEDRNLAAALVAVQFSQQQKQQQQQLQQDTGVVINTSLPSLVSNSSLDSSKVNLGEQQLILTEKAAAALNGGYLQIVSHDGIYVDKQSLPKLLDGRFAATEEGSYEQTVDGKDVVKGDEDAENPGAQRDSDGETKGDNRSSKKSLPHKKRISRKLTKKCPTTRKVNKCNLCEQTFSSTEEFSEHQTLCETTITPIHNSAFSCQLCSSTFADQLNFFEHLKAHYEPLVEMEEGPVKTAKTEAPEDPQKESLLSSLLNNIHCIQCNKTFKRQKTYEAHIREVHNKIELNDEFSEPEDLMAGINVVVEQNGQNSDEDSKAWYRDDELHATEADLREFEAQEHVCHICKQPFPIRAILLQHLVTCRDNADGFVDCGLPEKVESNSKKKGRKRSEELACTECDRVFTHRNSLVYHMRSHTGDRPHQCEQCGKSFFAASALKVHLRLHTGDKPYRCEHCGRNFRQWGDLKYHCISIHSDEKEYQCEYCGKDFARKYSLIVHRRIHTGEKNYKCEFCQKTFRASSYLQNHRRIHTGEKPHICEVCSKPFRVRSDMKRHLKTHGRRKIVAKQVPANNNYSNTSEIIITKVEDIDGSEGASEGSNGPRQANKPTDNESESAVSSLQFDQDPLDNARDGNTLYTNGQQLFICYAGEPIRNVESSTTWIQTE